LGARPPRDQARREAAGFKRVEVRRVILESVAMNNNQQLYDGQFTAMGFHSEMSRPNTDTMQGCFVTPGLDVLLGTPTCGGHSRDLITEQFTSSFVLVEASREVAWIHLCPVFQKTVHVHSCIY